MHKNRGIEVRHDHLCAVTFIETKYDHQAIFRLLLESDRCRLRLNSHPFFLVEFHTKCSSKQGCMLHVGECYGEDMALVLSKIRALL